MSDGARSQSDRDSDVGILATTVAFDFTDKVIQSLDFHDARKFMDRGLFV